MILQVVVLPYIYIYFQTRLVPTPFKFKLELRGPCKWPKTNGYLGFSSLSGVITLTYNWWRPTRRFELHLSFAKKKCSGDIVIKTGFINIFGKMKHVSNALKTIYPFTSPKTNMTSWKITMFWRRYIFIHGWISLLSFVRFLGVYYVFFVGTQQLLPSTSSC